MQKLLEPPEGRCFKATCAKRQTSTLLSAAKMLTGVSSQGNILEDTMATTAENLEDTVTDTVTTAVSTSRESYLPSGAPGVSQLELALLRSRLQHLEYLVTELAARVPESLLEKLAILKSGFEGLERVNRRCTVASSE